MRRDLRRITGASLATAVLVAGCSTAVPDLAAPPQIDGWLGGQHASGAIEPIEDLPWWPEVTVPVAPGERSADLQASSPADPIEAAEIHTMAALMSGALAGGDARAWLSHFDSDAVSEHDDAVSLVDAQLAWFETVQAIPMEVREVHYTRSIDTGTSDGSAFAVVEISFRHQVTGADQVPAVQRYRMRLERDEDAFAEVTEVDGVGGFDYSYPQAWDLGDTTVHVGDALILLSRPELAEDINLVLPELEEASAAVLTDFAVDGVSRLLVTAVESRELSVLFGEDDMEGYAGFALNLSGSETVDDRGPELTTRLPTSEFSPARVVIDLDYTVEEVEYFDGLIGGSPLMRHEGLHVMMSLQHPSVRTALWISEGVAGWYEVIGDPVVTEGMYDHFRWTSGRSAPESIPPADPLNFHDDDVSAHYSQAAMLFLYIEQRWGYQVTYDLGVDLHGVRLAGDPDEVLREHLGIDLEELERDWIVWAAEQLD